MSTPAQQYLKLRSVGAPAVLLSLAMQGVFRGLKDTRTPLYATGCNSFVVIIIRLFIHQVKTNDIYVYRDLVAGDVANIILDPIFMFWLKMGVRGAATAHVISQ